MIGTVATINIPGKYLLPYQVIKAYPVSYDLMVAMFEVDCLIHNLNQISSKNFLFLCLCVHEHSWAILKKKLPIKKGIQKLFLVNNFLSHYFLQLVRSSLY